mgnify:FL=1
MISALAIIVPNVAHATNHEKGKTKMSLNFYYCKGDGFHAVIEDRNENFATEYFVYLMNELLEPEKGINIKDVVCEPVNVYNYKREEIDGEDLLDAISWMFAAKKSHPSLLLPAWVTKRQVSHIP